MSESRLKRQRLKVFFKRLLGSRPQVVPNDPQSLPDSGTHFPSSSTPVQNPIDETHGSPSPLSIHARGGKLNLTKPSNGTHAGSSPSLLTDTRTHNPNMTNLTSNSSPSPPETHSLPPADTTHTSPHVEDDLNINGPTGDTHTSSSPSRPELHAVPVTSTGANTFSGAQNFVINNQVISVQGDSNTISQGMKALSEHVIKGAEYDSSLRDPPPQCHPGTRVQLMEKILVWFRNHGREKALLWLSGPAGVGKSAVIQTVAESLAESNSVGATLFFSRLNDRNDPQRVFITLAYQLATRIPAYQIYITGRIALDPSLLEKGMRDQFRTFIAEPFGINGIRKGEGTWAIMLDGLDECEGVDEQSRIVTLISEFALKFPNASLIWTIASRPEPHIVVAFNDEAVAPSYWSEYVPIDSTQACWDVEHYLNARFKAMRKPFPHLPPTWPSESQFLKLSNGARGLFVFARTAVRFMEDPNYVDPVSRLNLILSIIDGLDIKLINDHPFALLDALYTQMLVSIPSSVWPTTKRLLGFVICARSGVRSNVRSPGRKDMEPSGLSRDGHSSSLNSESLLGASIILSLELSVAYGSLHKLHSVLKIPDPKEAHKSMVTFLHASFGDYLVDRVRSKDFYIDRREVVDDIAHGLFQLYLDKPWITKWERYTPHHLPEGSKVYKDLKRDAIINLEIVLTGSLLSERRGEAFWSQRDRSDCLNALSRINLAESYQSDVPGTVLTSMIKLWNTFREELESTGRFKEVPLRDLKVDHLSDESNELVFVHKYGDLRLFIPEDPQWVKRQLHEHLRSHPERPAMIYGSGPESRIAFFAGAVATTFSDVDGYFCFPYPY